CGFGYCSVTNKRVQSPIINCTGHSSIIATFLYYEGSEAADDATFVYSADGGTTWTTIDPLAKTTTSCAAPAGTWNTITVSLPASANNNAMVKIGFNWTNNASGGTDPSCAFDDITLSDGPSSIATVQVSQLNLFAAGNGQIAIVPNGNPYKVIGIYDMLGQDVKFNQAENIISLAEATPGIYIVNLEVNGTRVVKKVMMN
ncbi:MAG TPA: T9SS type A sorting domain-containing protein, partial [Bacteroidia bacterium]|nr:T9SS type A sorting domain-containing protein [Bacteroidia bacterium]